MAIVDVFHRQLHRGTHRFRGITHIVVRFVLRFQAVDDLHRFFNGRFSNVDFLEATRQGAVFFENIAELLVGGRANYPDLAAGEQRFNQVGRIHLATRGSTGTDDSVDLIDKQDAVGILLQLFQQRFEPFFKITAVFGSGQQRTDIQRVDGAIGDHFRNVALHNAPGQPFSNGRFTDAGFTHQQRVVLAAAAQYLDRPFQLFLAANQRVNTADAGKLVKIGGEVFHTFLPACLLFAVDLMAGIGCLIRLVFSRSMRDEVHHIEAADFVFAQQVGRLRLLLAEDGNQHVSTGDFATP